MLRHVSVARQMNVASPTDLDIAFARIAQQDVGGLLTAADPFVINQRNRIIALAEGGR
jgi:hypothetical protein